MRMRKGSTVHCSLLRFWVPLLLLASFSYAPSVFAATEISGNEVNTDEKVVNEELAKSSLKGHDEEEKFKGFIPKPIPKPIPIIKPVPKIIPVIKPIPKVIPVIKPVPVYKPVPKVIPLVKPIPIIKPIPKPFTEEKPILLKPKPFFKKHFPKLPFHPKFKKPLLPPLPVHKPIPTP